MDRKEKIYQVLPGKKYTGVHAVYVGKNDNKVEGDKFQGTELMGAEANIVMALEGSRTHKVAPVIKVYTAKKADIKKEEVKK